QKRGQNVALVDRRPPAEETSYGNAGIIQREGVMPYTFPRDLSTALRYALNRTSEANIHYGALPELAPWLYQYWRNGSPDRVMRTANAANPLIKECLSEHRKWIEEAGVEHLVRDTGYLQLYRDADKLEIAVKAKQATRERFGILFDRLNGAGIRDLEPHLSGDFAGAIHVTQPASVADPSALGKAYARLFKDAGGTLRTADARSLEQINGGWQVQSVDGPVTAVNAVIALGPWAGEVLMPLGLSVPLASKRGYHMHYSARGNAGLARPILDTDYGYVLTPTTKGIRLTTGAEFARYDALPTPVQLAKVEPLARELFPIDQRVEDQPWLGRRPCLPDMLPVIGAVPGRRGLWANFGHHHLGFTLGPITARLLAEMMTGAPTYTDPAPYRIDRF
ncbi:MAG: FAD-binding oxidoreductase, partial [Alphaproteobacteria bacterium]|nr:FAD-binding oxidoreductase [Alphaproteobacteria bacterium]